MNKYESIVIIRAEVEEEARKVLLDKFSEIINNDGKSESIEDMGLRKLAYEIKKQKEGYYIAIKFEANPTVITELERVFRITDEVLKFMTIKMDD